MWARVYCLLIPALSLGVGAAPLFPETGAGTWAREAVARLAADGLLEGYPGDTYRGDRAATRWEVALLLARVLERVRSGHVLLADRAQLDRLRHLVADFSEELTQLGLRLNLLEERLGRLQERVDDLNRLTFYGEVQTRFTVQSFTNRGSSQSDPLAPVLPYAQMVGALSGAGDDVGVGPAAEIDFNPRFFGVMPVADLRTTTPLVSGSAWTSRLMLGMRANLDPQADLTAGLELAAYSSQGRQAVDAYAGVSAPYLSNPFTAQGSGNQDNGPFTKTTLDHFWLRHGPSQTTVTIGAFRTSSFDSLVYRPQPNPNLFGPLFLDNYGVQVKGQGIELNDDARLSYEVMATRLADGNEGLAGSGYYSHAEGFSLSASFHQSRGSARFNLLRACNEAANGAPASVGLISKVNQQSPTPWVNPEAFFNARLGPVERAGAGSVSDIRPVPGLNGLDGNSLAAGDPAVGNLGPQQQLLWGVSVNYHFEHWLRPLVYGEWARSHYKPQRNSSYSAQDQAWRVGLSGTIPLGPREELEEGQEVQPEDCLGLNLDVHYLSVGPRYDPFILQVPRVVGANSLYRTPDANYSAYLYPLHNTAVYPHNRRGFRLKADWEYAAEGHLELAYSSLEQTLTSQQDIRYSAASLGAAPDSQVLGFSPGFVDPVFGGLALPTFVSQGSNQLGLALENPRGRARSWSVSLFHHFDLEEDGSRRLSLQANFGRFDFDRPSRLSQLRPGAVGLLGENINRVDLRYQNLEVELAYDWSEEVRSRLGYFQAKYKGHLDPFGIYGNFAVQSGTAGFDNLDLIQHQPYLGLEWKVEENTTFDCELRLFQTSDHVPASTFPTPAQPGLNQQFASQFSAHPFSWSGYRLTSGMSLRF
ncbi:MAG: S-layer homology domain-containing protein [Vulcanimicrobiota bacterium]